MFGRKIDPARVVEVRAKFQPQPDITAYELAQIVGRQVSGLFTSMAQAIRFTPEQWENLAPELKRHFKRIDE